MALGRRSYVYRVVVDSLPADWTKRTPLPRRYFSRRAAKRRLAVYEALGCGAYIQTGAVVWADARRRRPARARPVIDTIAMEEM